MNKRGINLIEVLIIIVVLAIGILIAVPRLSQSNSEAKAGVQEVKEISGIQVMPQEVAMSRPTGGYTAVPNPHTMKGLFVLVVPENKLGMLENVTFKAMDYWNTSSVVVQKVNLKKNDRVWWEITVSLPNAPL